MFLMRAGGRGVENEGEIFFLLEQSFDAFSSRSQTLLARSRQTFRLGNDARHDRRMKHLTAPQLVHEIRANVAGAQYRYWRFAHKVPCSADFFSSASVLLAVHSSMPLRLRAIALRIIFSAASVTWRHRKDRFVLSCTAGRKKPLLYRDKSQTGARSAPYSFHFDHLR
jgi:hypothetical protein